jgi:hypothetical protein
MQEKITAAEMAARWRARAAAKRREGTPLFATDMTGAAMLYAMAEQLELCALELLDDLYTGP